MSEDALESATRELKRADHSIAVSLKYTRTVDVIKSIVQRLINTAAFSLDALLILSKSQKKIDELPQLPRMKVELARKLYGDDPFVIDMCDFFLLLRRIDKAKFTRAQEYRRHVTMTATLDTGETVQITIDIISDYFERTKEFLNHVTKLTVGSE